LGEFLVRDTLRDRQSLVVVAGLKIAGEHRANGRCTVYQTYCWM